jgi:hypothetical protein
MTKRGLISLFIKMVAIYAIVRSIPSLVSVGTSLTSLRSIGTIESFLIVGASIISLTLFATLMFFVIKKSERISAWFVSDDEVVFPIGNLSLRDIQAIAFSCIGLMALLSGVSGTVYDFAFLVRVKAMMGPEEVKLSNIQHLPANLISNIFEIGTGVFLFLYPKGIAKLWHSIQSKSTSNQDVQRDAGSTGAPDA